jgi:hypothetical protein
VRNSRLSFKNPLPAAWPPLLTELGAFSCPDPLVAKTLSDRDTLFANYRFDGVGDQNSRPNPLHLMVLANCGKFEPLRKAPITKICGGILGRSVAEGLGGVWWATGRRPLAGGAAS